MMHIYIAVHDYWKIIRWRQTSDILLHIYLPIQFESFLIEKKKTVTAEIMYIKSDSCSNTISTWHVNLNLEFLETTVFVP